MKREGVTTIRMFNWQQRKTSAVDGKSFMNCKFEASRSLKFAPITHLCCSCPKCMEEANRDGDDQSVKSGRSLRSTSKKMEQPQTSSSATGGGKSKKKWNLFKGSTGDQPQGDDDDDRSVKSNKSTRSNKSSRSTSKRGQAATSSRYGSMPFDGDGYCVQ